MRLESDRIRHCLAHPEHPGSNPRVGDILLSRSAVMLAWLATIVAAITALVLAGSVVTPAAPAASAAVPNAGPSDSSAVGALFTIAGRRLGQHFCTASVVASPRGDLVLTAAHCVVGRSARAIAFVPDYANGRAPFGIWLVRRVVVDQGWRSSADPDDDFAFLVVSHPGTSVALQSLTGGETVGVGAAPGALVTVAGYPDGIGTQISCQNTALPFSATQFQFDCGGYTNGTSGGPFLIDVTTPGDAGTVIGVIGGYQQGGDTPSVSYAARFGANMAALYSSALAESGS